MRQNKYSRQTLVTGGAGFIGAHLVQALALRGTKVVVADCQPVSTKSPLQVLGLASLAEYLEVDLSDRSAVEKTIVGEFETIFHLAAQPIGHISQKIRERTISCNVDSTEIMLDFVRRGQAKRLIFASSACAFGVPDAKECPLKEESPMFSGLYPYTESKQQAERLIRDSRVNSSIARFVNIFGEGDWHYSRIVPRIVRQLLRGDELLSLSRSNGQTVLDFLHVSDAVAALQHVESHNIQNATSTTPASIFNFGPGMPVSVLKLIEEICSVFDGWARKVVIPRSISETEMHKYLDSTRAQQQLGWNAQAGRKGALRRTIAWYAQHGNKLHDIDAALSTSADRIPGLISMAPAA